MEDLRKLRFIPKDNSPTVHFAEAKHKTKKYRVGIKEKDRFQHTYIIGKTGTGKTTLMKIKIKQDIQNGKGIAIFDPHGDLAESVISMIPQHRQKDLIYFDFPNPNCKLQYNPIKRVSLHKRPLVASGLLEAFKKQFGADSWGVRMEHILRNCLLTLLDQKHADFSCITKLLNDKDYRNECIRNISNESVIDFWKYEFNQYPPYTRQSAIAPIQNKVGAYLSNPVTKRILVDNQNDVSFRQAMDSNKIIVFNLAKGRIGDDASNLLGGLFLTSLGLSAFSRQDIPENQRQSFFIYCDEFQNFTTPFMVNALSELRKYKIGLILAHQYLKQIDNDIREAILGNVGTMIVFRVGVADASYFAREFDGKISITNQPNFSMCLRSIENGNFSANI
ncbi:MAG: type IV secretory system conjugative DNA transfer family protein [Arenicella sp.]